MLTKLFAALLTVLLLTGSAPTQAKPVETAAIPQKTVVKEIQAPALPVETAENTEAVVEQTVTLLTAQEAEAIALAHAGLAAEQVTFSRSEFDKDDGAVQWEVEFRHEDWEYDYTVHAETGAILEWSKEYDPKTPTIVTEPPATEPSVTEPAEKELTAAEAKTIALAHAGLSETQVTRLKVEKDREKGVWVYEVEFRQGKLEYEYEIHAETGEILEWSKEIDD